jgi:hypothetical protein
MHDWQNMGHQKRQFYLALSTPGGGNSMTSDNGSSEEVGKCPLHCGCYEAPFHYMICRSDILLKSREDGKSVMKTALKKLCTAPSLQEAILNGLTCWEDETEYELDEFSHKYLFHEKHAQ